MATTFVYNSRLSTNERAERKLLATYVNVGTTAQKSWQLIGARVEDASIELNGDVETTADILGRSYSEYSGISPSMSMEPFVVIAGSKLHLKLMQYYYDKSWSKFSTFEVMNVFAYLTDTGATPTSEDAKYPAEIHQNCTIELTSIGGSSSVDMPINIHYSNDCTYGTVNMIGPGDADDDDSEFAFTAAS